MKRSTKLEHTRTWAFSSRTEMWEAGWCQQCLWLAEVRPGVGLGSSPPPKPFPSLHPAAALGTSMKAQWLHRDSSVVEDRGQEKLLSWDVSLGQDNEGQDSQNQVFISGLLDDYGWKLNFPLCKMGLIVLAFVKLHQTEILPYLEER